jgi:Protein of unknown function (DUF1214)
MSAALSGSSAPGDPARRGNRDVPARRLAAGTGFWSPTLYTEHHFFHPDELNRYSFGTKTENLHRAGDGSLTLTSSATPQMSGLSEVDIKRMRDQLFFEGPASFQPVPRCRHSFHPSRVSPRGRVCAVLSETRVAPRGSGKRRTV